MVNGKSDSHLPAAKVNGSPNSSAGSRRVTGKSLAPSASPAPRASALLKSLASVRPSLFLLPSTLIADIRSIMYPLLGFTLGIFWLILAMLPFLAKLLRPFSGIIVLAISALQFLLMFFVLFTPAWNYALMFMFAATLQVLSALKATSGFWRFVRTSPISLPPHHSLSSARALQSGASCHCSA